MTIETNAIVTGKVTGIKDFGAFVALPDGRSGLVHISEVAQGYVDDISQHLTVGQEVQVKVLEDRDGRINLSIKRAVKRVTKQMPLPELAFEDKLKNFMQSAESIESAEPLRSDRRKKGREREAYDEYEEYD